MADSAFRCPRCAGFLQWSCFTYDGLPVYRCSRDWVDQRYFVRDPVSGAPVAVRIEAHSHNDDIVAVPLSREEIAAQDEDARRHFKRRAVLHARAA